MEQIDTAMIFQGGLGFLLCLVILYYSRSRIRASRAVPLPPGPKPYPLVGNIYDIPLHAAWKAFKQWGDIYGDIIYFHTFGRKVIVINSATIAHDLLVKRSSIYSYRPYLPMANEVIGWNWALPSMDYGEKFKQHRKYLQQYFHKQNLPKYYHIQIDEVNRMLNDFLDDPDNYRAHLKRMAGGMTMRIAYGHEIKSQDDPYIALAEKGVMTVEAAGAIGAHIVDFIPWLRYIPDWFPGASIKSVPPGTQEDLRNFVHVPFDDVKDQMAKGTAVSCYVTDLMEETKGQDDEGVRSTAAITYAGGFDTTLAGLMTAVTALVAHPVLQARAQAEMDLVVGKDRLPTFADRDRMPYMQCIISEAIRWGATTPVGVPHRLSEDDHYNGMYLPAGTMILANTWGMLHDPVIYPDPAKFNPDRFLDGEGRTPQPDPRGPAFGFGRRVCPGKDHAENTMWIVTACIFYAFKITPSVGDDGKPVAIDLDFFEHSIRHPKPFKCDIKPRRSNSIALIRQTSET